MWARRDLASSFLFGVNFNSNITFQFILQEEKRAAKKAECLNCNETLCCELLLKYFFQSSQYSEEYYINFDLKQNKCVM